MQKPKNHSNLHILIQLTQLELVLLELVAKGQGKWSWYKFANAIAIDEQANNNYSAWVPDLPGCVATGRTIEEVEQQIKEAIVFHLEQLKQAGSSVPEPKTLCKYVEV